MNHTQLGNIAVGAPGSEARKQSNLDAWMTVYAVKIQEHMQLFPGRYSYAFSDDAMAKMRTAFDTGTFDNRGPSVKATCKHFGIAPTYKAIAEALNS